MIPSDNQAQVQYWNSEAAEKWVRHQQVMDHQLEAVTDLLLQKAGPNVREYAIDVGCGTGATLLRLAAAVGEEGRVVGCDVSSSMLALAQQRIAGAGMGNVQLVQADAQTHGFKGLHFDLVVSRFGVMFFADPMAAFANLRASVRKGGRLAFVCWGPLAENPLFLLPMRIAAQHLGPSEPPPPRSPGPLAFSDRGYVSDILRGAGWTNVQIEVQTPPLLGFATAEEQAAFAIEIGPVSRLVADRQPDAATVDALQVALSKELAHYRTRTGIELPSHLYYVIARA